MTIKEIKFYKHLLKFRYSSEADLSVIEEIFLDKMYRATEEIIKNLQHPVLDIGAHIGCFSIYASILNPQIKIIALEPEPNNFELLKQNIKINHCQNIIVKQYAVIHYHPERSEGSRPSRGSSSLAVPQNDDTKATLYLNPDSHNHSTFYQTENSIKVPATTLENLILKNKLNKIGLLKIDIEGAEFQIIKNLEKNIWDKIQYLAIEYHEFENNKRADLENIIRTHGFSLEHFPNHFDKRFGLFICRNKKTP